MEAVLLVAALSAISMAMIALHDLLTGPMSWWRKVVWSLLVLSLPLVGPILYYRRGAKRGTQRKRRTKSTHTEGK
jgi:Phospholipase_D-nuclease N-terminal